MKTIAKTLLLISVLVGFSGCATPGSLGEKTPEVEYITKKLPDEAVACVSEKWAANEPGVSTLNLPSKKIVQISREFLGTIALTVAENTDTGTRVRYFKQAGLYYPAWYREGVEKCQ